MVHAEARLLFWFIFHTLHTVSCHAEARLLFWFIFHTLHMVWYGENSYAEPCRFGSFMCFERHMELHPFRSSLAMLVYFSHITDGMVRSGSGRGFPRKKFPPTLSCFDMVLTFFYLMVHTARPLCHPGKWC
jgi:hypothetical protein